MIKLKVKICCHNCPDFEADVTSYVNNGSDY